ncbi:hypothetical protein H0O00_01445 [Candidatus Micrarchaeota archaeon]|nr:hypothetical protein [Candidatus Micrarchaeota archaeon]
MFGTEKVKSRSKKKFMGLTSAMEMAYEDPTRYGVVVDAASQLCDMLQQDEVSLTTAEKLRVMKSLTKAKVRAFMGGVSDNYRAFKSLDGISNSLIQLL